MGNANSGRHRKSLALRVIEGSARPADLQAAKAAAALLPPGAPAMPFALRPAAAEVWQTTAALLTKLRAITPADWPPLLALANATADYRLAYSHLQTDEAWVEMTPNGFAQPSPWARLAATAEDRMLRAAAKLGLEPLIRARMLQVAAQPALFDDDGIDAELARAADLLRRGEG